MSACGDTTIPLPRFRHVSLGALYLPRRLLISPTSSILFHVCYSPPYSSPPLIAQHHSRSRSLDDMQFPTQYFYKHSPTPSLSGSEEPAADAFQWEKFDNLFDQVFATSTKSTPSAEADPDFVPMPRAVPGAYLRRMTSSGGESSASDDSVAGDLFERAWGDAVKKTQKTITTTTKRRIIRHTPPAEPTATVSAPPTPSRLQIPAATPARLKYPRTPYPRSTRSLDEESSEETTDSSEGHTKSAARGLKAPQPQSRVDTLKIPESGLTPELHSPVLWKP